MLRFGLRVTSKIQVNFRFTQLEVLIFVETQRNFLICSSFINSFKVGEYILR